METTTRVARHEERRVKRKKQRRVTGLAILYVVLNSSTMVECVKFLLQLAVS